MLQVCIELLRGAFTLVAVALGSSIALRVYFRQKEYELVKQRYLEGGVDVVAAEIESVLGVVSHNWARCLQVCKSFRDTAENFDIKELERGFLDLDNSKFQQIAHLRISSLLQSQVVWNTFQSAMAYASSANAMITKEMPEAMRLRCTTGRIAVSHGSMADTMLVNLQELHNDGFRYTPLIRELHALSRMLEAEKLKLKAVAQFSTRPEVQHLIERLRTAFPDQENYS
ncbi:hypothetical protein [Rhodoferax sediminis]|jgi:hypothetical protein|uniref:hypothetical protein n=1 Tax=Rhodoferax sediminis TaxID=2509614 RepID=UPI00115D1783|nr:hypothetical protein [Rhodoferax sediminis]